MAGRKMVMVTHLLLSSKLLIHFQRHDVNDFSIRDFKLFSACCFSPVSYTHLTLPTSDLV